MYSAHHGHTEPKYQAEVTVSGQLFKYLALGSWGVFSAMPQMSGLHTCPQVLWDGMLPTMPEQGINLDSGTNMKALFLTKTLIHAQLSYKRW